MRIEKIQLQYSRSQLMTGRFMDEVKRGNLNMYENRDDMEGDDGKHFMEGTFGTRMPLIDKEVIIIPPAVIYFFNK